MEKDVMKTKRRFGRCGKLVALLAVIVVVAWASTSTSVAPAKDEAPQKAVVPFEMLSSNHMLVSAKINGKGPYEFIFDLGAPITLVSNWAAEDSGIVDRNAPRALFFAVRGEHEVKKLELGTLKDTKVPVIVLDHPILGALGKAINRRLDGIIGYTFFAHYRTTIDYKARTIAFEPVNFQVRDLIKDLEKRLSGPKVARERVLAPAALWGLTVGDPVGGLKSPGVPIVSVKSGSPAEAAGLQGGDIMTTLDGRWTTSINDTYAAAAGVPAGRSVPVVVLRDGKELTVTVTPREGF